MQYRGFSVGVAAAVMMFAAGQAGARDSVSYEYDALGRLSKATNSDGTIIAYSYDPAGNRTQQTISGGPNRPPTAKADAVIATKNAAKTITTLLANDSDPEGQTLSITGGTQPLHGAATFSAGSVVYTPVTNYVGADRFTYTISDGAGGTATGVVGVTVTNANQPPVALNDPLLVQKGGSGTVNLLNNDSDPEGQTLSVTGTTTPANGSVSLSGGLATYTPTPSFSGADSFTYTLSDGALTATGTVNITVNAPPTATANSRTTLRNVADAFNPAADDTDSDGGTISLTGVNNATNGTVALAGSTATFTPTTGFTGTGGYDYTISDGQGGGAIGHVTVTVNAPANQPPNAVDDTIYVQIGVIRTFNPRTNDTDPDGDTLTIVSPTTTAPTQGTTLVQSGTTIRYTPSSPTYAGTDSFTYTVTDGNGGSDTATVSLIYNYAPIATNDSVTTTAGTAVTFDPRVNDSDPESQTLTLSASTNGTNGTVARVSGNTQLRYTPNSGFTGTDTFTYTIGDQRGGTATATVTVTVN